MSRLIDADEEIKQLNRINIKLLGDNEIYSIGYAKSVLMNAPSAERKQGTWFIEPSKGNITCSTCKEEISYYPSIGNKPIWDYCPYCGSYNGGAQNG